MMLFWLVRTSVKVLLAGLGVIFLLLAGGLIYLERLEPLFRTESPTETLPMLVRNLPGPLVTDVRKAFHDRVRNKFPNGMGSDALATELQREGFRFGRSPPAIDTSRPYFAYVEQHGGMCLKVWSISWHRDAQGRAQDIDERFRYDCP